MIKKTVVDPDGRDTVCLISYSCDRKKAEAVTSRLKARYKTHTHSVGSQRGRERTNRKNMLTILSSRSLSL